MTPVHFSIRRLNIFTFVILIAFNSFDSRHACTEARVNKNSIHDPYARTKLRDNGASNVIIIDSSSQWLANGRVCNFGLITGGVLQSRIAAVSKLYLSRQSEVYTRITFG